MSTIVKVVTIKSYFKTLLTIKICNYNRIEAYFRHLKSSSNRFTQGENIKSFRYVYYL